jgi:hypothetical protein
MHYVLYSNNANAEEAIELKHQVQKTKNNKEPTKNIKEPAVVT